MSVKDYDFILNKIFVFKICNVAKIKQIKLLTEKKKLACVKFVCGKKLSVILTVNT